MCLDKGNGNAWFCIFMTHNKNGCTCSNNGKCQFNQIYLLNLEKVLSFYEVEGNLHLQPSE